MNWVCHLLWSSWTLSGNSIWTSAYPKSMRSSCSTATLTRLLMDRSRTNQLLDLSRDVISTVTMRTGRCIMRRHAEKTRLPFNDFCRGCSFGKEQETLILFLCLCLSFLRCWYRSFDLPFLLRCLLYFDAHCIFYDDHVYFTFHIKLLFFFVLFLWLKL